MSTAAEQRTTIIASVFSRRNAANNLEEAYISHVKVWEDAGPEGRKPRYILLSRAANNSGYIHKSKVNTNGTYSVGKTWRLAELRGVQVLSSMAFNITLSRTYRWDTENAGDQNDFINALTDLYNELHGGGPPLRIEGMAPRAPQVNRMPVQDGYLRSQRPPSPQRAPSAMNGRSPMRRAQTPTQASDRDGDLTSMPRSQSRTAIARPISPTSSQRGASYPREIPAPRPPSSASNISSSYPSRPARRPSNATPPSSSIPPSSSQSSFSLRPDGLPTNLKSSPEPPPSIRSQPSSQSTTTRSRPPSPTASVSSRVTQSTTRNGRNSPSVSRPRPAPTQPARETTTAEPLAARSSRPKTPPESRPRRDPNARISFFDHANQATLDRILSQGTNEEGEEESSQATMASVEEMLEGYEWASDDVIGRRTVRGAAELIEARLLDELTALDKANIHSFLETDDRVAIVMKFLDEAISELDNTDSLVSSYKIHLNNVGDDITYIQSQNRGLQVQTQNQRALLSELENLLKTVQVSKSALVALTQESLEKSDSIQRLEEAAVELYKALQAGRDTEMAASMERLQEYRTHNAQFCKRLLDFLSIMSTAQGKLLLGDNNGVLIDSRGRPSVVAHTELEAYLGRYAGLMLFLKEMDESIYAKLCAAYFSASSELANAQIKAFFSAFLALVRRAKDEEVDQTFNPNSGAGKGATGIRRAGTIIRSPMDGSRRDKDKDSGDVRASEVLLMLLDQLSSLVYREDEFIADFLQINDAALTFADYMNLDNYFRRQAIRSAGLSPQTTKLVRGAMELIFGFLPLELKAWLDAALQKDDMQLIGLMVCLERFLTDADEKNNPFLQSTLEKQHTRLKALLDRHISEQIRQVEQTKMTSKKRRGVVHFMKHFPVYISRVEAQMYGADGLEIRGLIDSTYERLVQTMFDCLKQIAKMEGGEGEDKGQLNYHIILIENTHYFVTEMSQSELGSVGTFVRKAQSIYDESVSAYVKMILRRPFAKIIDYFEGIERLLKTTAPTEVATNSNYNKSSLKKIAKDYNAKDIRKHADALAKRVEKHFLEGNENSSNIVSGVLTGVWKACEEELVRISDVFAKRVAQCYPDTGVTLEYTRADVEAAFRKQRFGV